MSRPKLRRRIGLDARADVLLDQQHRDHGGDHQVVREVEVRQAQEGTADDSSRPADTCTIAPSSTAHFSSGCVLRETETAGLRAR